MDIKKIIRQFLLEQEGEEIAPQQPQLTRQQKEFFDRLSSKWKQDNPELTDDVMSEKTKIILAHYVVNEHKYDEETCKVFEETMTLPD